MFTVQCFVLGSGLLWSYSSSLDTIICFLMLLSSSSTAVLFKYHFYNFMIQQFEAPVHHYQEGMILEMCATSDIYSVNKKVKDGSKIEPSPYSYPCIVICISVDDLTLLQTYIMFYSNPRLPDFAHHSADIPQKISLLSL